MIKSIKANIGVHGYRNHIKLPMMLSCSDDANILDIIGMLDKMYYEQVIQEGKQGSKDFYWKNMKSLMQLFWNPITQKFFEDVGIEAWTEEDKPIPIEKDWRTIIPDKSWVYLTPDAGC
ncbi:MAG: hypothetical protein ACTSWL_00400 [Promethearchaeota archaeon]